MSAISGILKTLVDLLSMVQTNPILLIFLIALAALAVAAFALRVVHSVVVKK